MSSKARKRINRMMRMSGRTCSSQNNLAQLVDSKRWQQDVAAGGMDELQALSDKLVAEEKAKEELREAELARLLGFFA